MVSPLSVAPRFPDSADCQKMLAVLVWSVLLVYWISPVAGIRYTDPGMGDLEEKRIQDLGEPTCDQLRAMWRYTKRQSRAAKSTTGYPLYPDPFYNMWQAYPDRSKSSLTYRGRFAGRARSRAAGGAPIYGRVVHKAPAGSRLRNGMRHRTRMFEDVARLYGTVNRYPPSSRRRLTSFRVGGGMSPPLSQVPQAGSFYELKEKIRAERARELQEQHIAEAEAAKAGYGDTSDEDRLGMQHPQKQYLNPLPPLPIPTKVNYEFGQGRYMSNVPNIGQAWSRSGPQSREYMRR